MWSYSYTVSAMLGKLIFGKMSLYFWRLGFIDKFSESSSQYIYHKSLLLSLVKPLNHSKHEKDINILLQYG